MYIHNNIWMGKYIYIYIYICIQREREREREREIHKQRDTFAWPNTIKAISRLRQTMPTPAW